MKRVILWPHNMGSQGCKNLAQRLPAEARALRVRSNGGYRPHPNHLIINWGNNELSPWGAVRPVMPILNFPSSVATASNKLSFFRASVQEDGFATTLSMEGDKFAVPAWTTDKRDAERWIRDGKRVYCRTLLRASCGDGIVLATTPEELVNAPLYTVGIDIRREWRVHVFNGRVIDVVQKRRRVQEDGSPDQSADLYIRNHARGWVFCHSGFDRDNAVDELAVQAVRAVGLDFGAVDIITEKRTGTPYVLEINTAPGLESEQTLAAYVGAITELARGNNV